MMNKSLNYAYPRKYAEGGEVPQTNTFVRDGVEFVEHNGQMVSKEALDVLNMAVGLRDEDMRYDVNNDGRIGAGDAVEFLRYAKLEDYNDDSGFMSQFYDQGAAAENPTYTDQVPGYTEGGVEFQGPDMPPPRPEGVATTRMVGEEEGMEGLPPPGMATTMAMGEEDGGGGGIEPDLPRPPNPFLGLEPDTFTTMAKGEEDNFLPIPEKPIGDLTTMAMGEEDGGGAFPLPPPSQIDPPDMATTTAMGEEDGGMPLPPGVDPMFPAPVVTPPPNTGYTPPPVVAPEFAPLPVAPDLPQGGSQGRTYGAYSQAGQLGGTTLRPFTPYMPPQQNEGIRSLIDEPVSYLTESGPRSSVFRRS
jgi:hypothetical protein